MSIDAINPESVRDVLHAIRYGRPLDRSPLVHLALVTAGLRAEGLADTPVSRAWVLGGCIHDTVARRLGALRGQAPGTAPSERTPEREWQLLAEDLAADSIERGAWGLLHFRYLSLGHRPMRAVVDDLGLPKRTVAFRIDRARAALAEALRGAEAEAARQLATRAGGPAAERILVTAATAPRSPLEVQAGLLGAVRTNGHGFHVSAGELARAALAPVTDLVGYRLGRIAEWSQPRYRLDRRFVALTLLVDLGEEAQSGRWQARDERFHDLRDVLATVREPAIVLLGPPGAGKSTLLRRLELDLAAAALQAGTLPASGADAAPHGAPITFLVSLNAYRAAVPGDPPPEPRAWLAEHWATRYPRLQPLTELLAEGRVTLLLDGLNEIPHRDQDEYRAHVMAWKHFLHAHLAAVPGNRAVVACRSLDYSAPLSSPRLRVPQVRLEPLSDEEVRAFLAHYSPAQAETLWSALVSAPLVESMRWPFLLRLLAEHASASGELAVDVPALFTGFVRRALVREVERDNPLFAPGALLDRRDLQRLVSGRSWRTAWDLPASGDLIPALARLAHRMQSAAAAEEMSQVRIARAAAIDALGDEHGRAVIDAAIALGVLDEDPATGEVLFGHQLLQEYFAARELGRRPEPARLATPWRIADIRPGLREVLDALPAAERLPALPTTGWEETAILAAGMIDQPEPFLRALMPHNLVVAARAARAVLRPPAAATPGRAPLSPAFLDELRWALVRRSRDPAADLRARIDAGLALGWLGDPRFERRTGPDGDYLLPPLADVPGGVFPIGDDEPIEWAGGVIRMHIPRHDVAIAAFRLGRYPVTNAEYALFMAAGGYDDETLWDTTAGRAWRHGHGTHAGNRQDVRYQLELFRADPAGIDRAHEIGTMTAELRDLWHRRLAMTATELEAHLLQIYPDVPLSEPQCWRRDPFNHPARPVVGVSWYEARAYAAWLARQTGQRFRLPTEVEWLAVARGTTGRRYAYGDTFDPLKANTTETRLGRATPGGVFIEGDTPEGVSDMTGNVAEWLSSAIRARGEGPIYAYPYVATDGREEADAPANVGRAAKGAGWAYESWHAASVLRGHQLPSFRSPIQGFRLALSATAERVSDRA